MLFVAVLMLGVWDMRCNEFMNYYFQGFGYWGRSAIGLYEVLLFLSLLGLRIGIILAVFQEFGIVFVFIALLYNSVSAFIAVGPMCFICVLEMLSGPVDILGFV